MGILKTHKRMRATHFFGSGSCHQLLQRSHRQSLLYDEYTLWKIRRNILQKDEFICYFRLRRLHAMRRQIHSPCQLCSPENSVCCQSLLLPNTHARLWLCTKDIPCLPEIPIKRLLGMPSTVRKREQTGNVWVCWRGFSRFQGNCSHI